MLSILENYSRDFTNSYDFHMFCFPVTRLVFDIDLLPIEFETLHKLIRFILFCNYCPKP